MGSSQKHSIETQTRSYSAMNLLKGANEISGCNSQDQVTIYYHQDYDEIQENKSVLLGSRHVSYLRDWQASYRTVHLWI